MSMLVNVQSVRAAYGARVLFEDVSLGLADNDRLGLMGPNGAGKSTLLRIIAGLESPDAGTRSVRNLARIAYVPQTHDFDPERTAAEVVGEAIAKLDLDPVTAGVRIATALGRVGLAGEGTVATLSGGWRKRLAIACALAVEPDALLLDEPTNHLDIEGVLWLEKLITSSGIATLFVTHDRVFLENVATRMVELSAIYPGGTFEVRGNYSEFLVRRGDYLETQARYEEALKNRVRREVEWLRRGPKARATKAKYRVEGAGRLVEELADLKTRRRSQSVGITFDGSGRKTRQLLVAEGISKALSNRPLFSGVDLILSPGTRVGVVGRNGSGKTTLLRVLTGELEPDEGVIRRADSLQMVYFDQNRDTLDLSVSLRKALVPAGGDSVVYRGAVMHVAAWAKRFLFRAEQLDVAVGTLSGGEQNRVLVARLMLRAADVLVLDEPTNDLDIATLEVLEESLLEFPGSLVLVTHDRYLLDRIANVVVGLDGAGEATVHADYEQWEDHIRSKREKTTVARSAEPRRTRRSMSYKEKQELEQMEQNILAAEEKLAESQAKLSDPAMASDSKRLQECWAEVEQAKKAVETLYERWQELEKMAGP